MPPYPDLSLVTEDGEKHVLQFANHEDKLSWLGLVLLLLPTFKSQQEELRAMEGTVEAVLLACAATYLVGRMLAPWAERESGKDPQVFVLDEVLGYLITVAWVRGPSLVTLVVGFALFRFFDVLKPGPVRRMERFPGGDGILLDDLVAGLLGLVVLTAARLLVGDPSMWEVS